MRDWASLDSLGLIGYFRVAADGRAEGYVYDPNDLAERFVIEIVVDGLPIALLKAQEYWDRPPALLAGDRCYGFGAQLSPGVVAEGRTFEARLANVGACVGSIVNTGQGLPAAESASLIGEAEWTSGLTITGWLLPSKLGAERHVTAVVEGRVVAEVLCDRWTHVERLGNVDVAPAFRLTLPTKFADGRVRSVEIRDDQGAELRGSPVLVIAFQDRLLDMIDGFASLQSERVRARFADGLLPQSVPFTTFDDWLARFDDTAPLVRQASKVGVVLIGEHDVEASLTSLQAQTDCTWVLGILAAGMTCCSFDSGQLPTLLGEMGRDCDFFVFALAGTTFKPHALARLSAAFGEFPDAQSVYSDVLLTVDGQGYPLALPSFDQERWLEQGYCCLLFGIRPAAVEKALFSRCDSIFSVFGCQFDSLLRPAPCPIHVPWVIASIPELPLGDLRLDLLRATAEHFESRGEEVAVQAGFGSVLPNIRISRKRQIGSISVIVPLQNGADLLQLSLESLRSSMQAISHEIILADSGIVDEPTLRAVREASAGGCRWHRVPGWRCTPRMINQSANQAKGDFLLVLDCGMKAVEPDWLEEILGRATDASVGAVAPVIVHPTGVVKYAGFIVGPQFDVAPAFADRLASDEGYGGLLRCAHESSAVSAACMLVRRSTFESFGGFDIGRFSTQLYDVDFCMRLRAAGLRIVVTPHARLELHKDRRAWRHGTSGETAVAERELSNLRSRWSIVPGCDPFYGPWLNMDGSPYAGLAWHPVAYSPRRSIDMFSAPALRRS